MFNINNLIIAPVNRVMEIVKDGKANAVLTVLSKYELDELYNKKPALRESDNLPVFDYRYVSGNNFEAIEEYIKPEDWKIVQFEDYEGGKSPVELPTEQAILEGVKFGIQKLDEGKKLLVHCQMGMSRSPAMAYLIMCHYMDPQDAANELYKIRQGIKPNLYIIRLGDDAMNLGYRALNAMVLKMQVEKELKSTFKNQFSNSPKG